MVSIFALSMIFGLVLAILFGIYNIFEKAGEPGWQAFIPLYNFYRLFKVAGLPGSWMLGLLIPFVNIFVYFMLGKALADRFDRSPGFAIGVCIFPWLFLPWLGYSSATYTPLEGNPPFYSMTEYDRSYPPQEDYRENEDDDDDQDGIERIPLEDW